MPDEHLAGEENLEESPFEGKEVSLGGGPLEAVRDTGEPETAAGDEQPESRVAEPAPTELSAAEAIRQRDGIFADLQRTRTERRQLESRMNDILGRIQDRDSESLELQEALAALEEDEETADLVREDPVGHIEQTIRSTAEELNERIDEVQGSMSEREMAAAYADHQRQTEQAYFAQAQGQAAKAREDHPDYDEAAQFAGQELLEEYRKHYPGVNDATIAASVNGLLGDLAVSHGSAGGSLAETIYSWAGELGWAPNGNAQEPAAVAPAQTAVARNRARAPGGVSGVPSSGTDPGRRINARQLSQMNDDEFAKFADGIGSDEEMMNAIFGN